MTAQLEELEAQMGQADFWNDARAAAGVSRHKVRLERELQQWREIEAKLSHVTTLAE
jgi:peptide chain release factor 2